MVSQAISTPFQTFTLHNTYYRHITPGRWPQAPFPQRAAIQRQESDSGFDPKTEPAAFLHQVQCLKLLC